MTLFAVERYRNADSSEGYFGFWLLPLDRNCERMESGIQAINGEGGQVGGLHENCEVPALFLAVVIGEASQPDYPGRISVPL